MSSTASSIKKLCAKLGTQAGRELAKNINNETRTLLVGAISMLSMASGMSDTEPQSARLLYSQARRLIGTKVPDAKR